MRRMPDVNDTPGPRLFEEKCDDVRGSHASGMINVMFYARRLASSERQDTPVDFGTTLFSMALGLHIMCYCI